MSDKNDPNDRNLKWVEDAYKLGVELGNWEGGERPTARLFRAFVKTMTFHQRYAQNYKPTPEMTWFFNLLYPELDEILGQLNGVNSPADDNHRQRLELLAEKLNDGINRDNVGLVELEGAMKIRGKGKSTQSTEMMNLAARFAQENGTTITGRLRSDHIPQHVEQTRAYLENVIEGPRRLIHLDFTAAEARISQALAMGWRPEFKCSDRPVDFVNFAGMDGQPIEIEEENE